MLITESSGWSEFIARDPDTGVDTIYSGVDQSENPYALFNSPAFGRFIDWLREEYDRVIIDTPPLAHFGDALALSPFADLALLVLRFNRTPVRLARRALASLREAGVPVPGAVVNGIRPMEIRMFFPGYYRRADRYNSRKSVPRPTAAYSSKSP
jgi:Mrp family chromosome partitioning ATPase